MHIAFYTNAYHPTTSGVVRSVSSFRKALTSLGHTVFIFAPDDNYEDEEPFVFRYPTFDLGLPQNTQAAIPVSSCLDKIFPSLKVDVIHTHHPVLLGQAAANKAEKHSLPLVFTFHTRYREYSQYLPIGADFIQGLVKDVIDIWVSKFIQRCQHVIVPSESIFKLLQDEYGVRDGMSVIPTGLDLEPYRKVDGHAIRKRYGWQGHQIMISVGRLAKEKNWLTLLAAAVPVLRSRPRARLVIVGDGDDRGDLEAFAQENGIGRQVDFTGQVPFETIPQYLKAADLFCFASTNETQGLATLEAMAAGLPVVAVDGTGTRDILDHDREGLLTANDPEALAQAMLGLLDEPERRQRYRQAGEAKAKRYSMKVQVEKLLEVYHLAQEARQANRFVTVESAGNRAQSAEVRPEAG